MLKQHKFTIDMSVSMSNNWLAVLHPNWCELDQEENVSGVGPAISGFEVCSFYAKQE